MLIGQAHAPAGQRIDPRCLQNIGVKADQFLYIEMRCVIAEIGIDLGAARPFRIFRRHREIGKTI